MSLPYVDTAGVWNWELYQGDSREWSFALSSNSNAGINVAGADITFTVKRQRGATVPAVYMATTANGFIVVSGAASNIITIDIPATNTATFPSGALVYDVQFVLGSQVVTYLTGIITATREVTP